jgi:chemotaxis protein methyltransferase CheR
MQDEKTVDEMNETPGLISGVRLSEREFRRLGEFIHASYGIKMPPVKKTMLQARLQKRLRMLGIGTFKAYIEYLFSPEGMREELPEMVNAVTTNKTDFFREPAHFDYLVNTALPELMSSTGAGIRRPLGIWSAGCSTGEEPYTLAMVLNNYAERNEGFRFSILGTDISLKVLEKAALGIYDENKVQPVPLEMKKKYLLRSKDKQKKHVRIVPELRSQVHFRSLNFMEGDFGMREKMDIIFCRNVIIYFDRTTQEGLLNRLASHLLPNGYLFMGHSETLSGLRVPLSLAAPTVYRRTG